MSTLRKCLVLALGATFVLVAPQMATSQEQSPQIPKVQIKVFYSPMKVSCPSGGVQSKWARLRIYNASTVPEVIYWHSTIARDSAKLCAADYTPKSGRVILNTGQYKDTYIKVMFVPDCAGTATITFTAYLESNRNDSDTKDLVIDCGGGAATGKCDVTGTGETCPGCYDMDTDDMCTGTDWESMDGVWTAGACDYSSTPDCSGCPQGDLDCESSDQFAVPAVSEWGMAVLVLLVMAAGTVIVIRRRTQPTT